MGEAGHETFYLEPGQTGFTSCKTAQKPYDVAVVAILCLAEFYSEGTYGVQSDGGPADWEEGLALARQIEPKCPLPDGVLCPG